MIEGGILMSDINTDGIGEKYKKKRPLRELQKNIIKARISSGLSQKELAEKMNTTQSVISNLESGEDYYPNLKTLIKLSKALNKKLEIKLS